MPDITMTISQGLNNRIVARWGSLANWKAWVRDQTRADLVNARISEAQIQASALLEAARAQAESDTAAL